MWGRVWDNFKETYPDAADWLDERDLIIKQRERWYMSVELSIFKVLTDRGL